MRLRDVLPHRYAISLQPDLVKFTFVGEEAVAISVTRPLREITLHSKGLDIRSAEVRKGGSAVRARRISYDAKNETATFHFPQRLARGRYELKVVFRGQLRDGMRGFYRSSYRAGGETRWLAVTQFEATDARRAFPCFDEPALKAVFQVSLVIPKDKVAISNTLPAVVRPQAGGLKTVVFAPTPKMSTYLLAFIIGDFEHIEKRTPEGVLLRVFTLPGKKQHARFALDCGAKTLSFFAKYFRIPYPLPVLNMIALPDFESAAMENWGAITYRESTLLFDAKNSSAVNQQWTALVIAHEIAHQWFGNLVTMEWWTHLWLNEGFASYIEYFAVDHIFPKWNIWTRLVSSDMGRGMKMDAFRNTHPIEVTVREAGEIDEIFDDISYRKGSSVIRMLADYLGEDMFRKGLTYYLKKHAYANATTDDLWRALQKVSGKPIQNMMRNWTRRGGYPLLKVARRGNGFQVRQSRFFSNPRSGRAAGTSAPWPVPVRTASAAGRRSQPALLAQRTGRLPGLPRGDWFKLNAGETAFFRTDYPDDIWRALAVPVAARKLPVNDRLGLMRDIVALAQSGARSAVDVLEFARNYRKETDYFVWLEVAAAISQIYNLVASEPFVTEYEKFARGVFADVASRLGWRASAKEDQSRKLLRSLALSQFGYYGDKATVARAKKLFAGVTVSRNNVHPDLRGVVYNLAARHGGAAAHAKLARLYAQTEFQEEKNRLGAALARFRDESLLRRTLAFSISKAVRMQDTPSMLASVWMNPAGWEVAWRFAQSNWKLIVKRYGEGHTLSRIVSAADSGNAEAQARDLERFFRANPMPASARRSLQQSLEEIRGNAAWLARDRAGLASWLSRKPL